MGRKNKYQILYDTIIDNLCLGFQMNIPKTTNTEIFLHIMRKSGYKIETIWPEYGVQIAYIDLEIDNLYIRIDSFSMDKIYTSTLSIVKR